MKKKTKTKVWKSIISILGILALAGVVFSLYALIYTFIYENPLRNLLISLGALLLLALAGGVSWKKIKSKIKDIFT